MIVLGMDTALGACSAALLRDGKVTARRFEPMTRGHVERLFPMLDEICAEAGMTLRDPDRIAVTVGPGSFTGTRTGLAAARGIALAARRPAVGVTTLRAIAAGAQGIAAATVVGVLIDARRGGFYGQLFETDGTALAEPFAAPAEELAAHIAEAGGEERPVALIGTGAEQGLEVLRSGRAGVSLATGNPLPDAGVVARLGAELDSRAAPPVPLYLRAPDAIPAAPASVVR